MARVTDDAIQKIQPGMGEAEVRALIGAPSGTTYFPRSNTTSWDYRYRDTGGYFATFSTIFDTSSPRSRSSWMNWTGCTRSRASASLR